MASIMMTIQVLVLSYLPHKMIFTGYPFIKCPSPNRGTLPSDLRLVLNFFTQRTAAVQKIEGHTDGKTERHSSWRVIITAVSPWAPGHICGVSTKLVVVVVLLFSVLVQGLTKVSDQSRALEDRNDSNNSLEVYTPNSFIHLFYNSPDMDIVNMHNILITPSDSVLWEKTMEASYHVGSFPCQFDFISVFDIPIWDEFWEQATFRHLCPFW